MSQAEQVERAEQSVEFAVAEAVSARLTELGSFAPDDCIMLIGSTVVGFGHARSDLDLLVSGRTPDRAPFHMFHDGRRVDVDFLDPAAWDDTREWVRTWARSITEPVCGRHAALVEDREWWSDHFWLYDRVVHGVVLTEDTAAGFLGDSTPAALGSAIGNYSRLLCRRMLRRARTHRRAGDLEAAAQYECETVLAAAEAVAAERGVTFWSDRTVLEKARRTHRAQDAWRPDDVEDLFDALVRRAWGSGPDRGAEVPGLVTAMLGPADGTDPGVDTDPGGDGTGIALADGWRAEVAAGGGFLMGPDRSLHAVPTQVARFVRDGGATPMLAAATATTLTAIGAAQIDPEAPARPVLTPPAPPGTLADACRRPVAPSPESWVSSRIAAQWYAMTVWSLSDDLHGAVQSGHHNRIMPILRKADLYLRMLVIAIEGVRPEVGRNVAMDLQGRVLTEGMERLLDCATGAGPDGESRLPELAVEVFSRVMVGCGLSARSDMFENRRAFMRQLGDVRTWIRVSTTFDLDVQVPGTLRSKGGDGGAADGSSVFVDVSSAGRTS